MNDLISRSALLEEFDWLNRACANDGANEVAAALVKLVEKAPTVDAEAVRHGRWLNKTERIYADLNYRFDCSVCSHIFYAAGIDTFNYCPNCGAKMDAEVQDD